MIVVSIIHPIYYEDYIGIEKLPGRRTEAEEQYQKALK